MDLNISPRAFCSTENTREPQLSENARGRIVTLTPAVFQVTVQHFVFPTEEQRSPQASHVYLRLGVTEVISVGRGVGPTEGGTAAKGGVLSGYSGRELGGLLKPLGGCYFLAPFQICEEEGSLIHNKKKNFMHNFREKEAKKPSLALLTESPTGRDKLSLERGARASLPVASIRSSVMSLGLEEP